MKSFKDYAKEDSEEDGSLFDLDIHRDPTYDRHGNVHDHIKREFALQDKVAAESEVFRRILQSEIKDDPAERFESTNNPKAKTRNALIVRCTFRKGDTGEFDKEAWEQYLLTNDYYGLT